MINLSKKYKTIINQIDTICIKSGNDTLARFNSIKSIDTNGIQPTRSPRSERPIRLSNMLDDSFIDAFPITSQRTEENVHGNAQFTEERIVIEHNLGYIPNCVIISPEQTNVVERYLYEITKDERYVYIYAYNNFGRRFSYFIG